MFVNYVHTMEQNAAQKNLLWVKNLWLINQATSRHFPITTILAVIPSEFDHCFSHLHGQLTFPSLASQQIVDTCHSRYCHGICRRSAFNSHIPCSCTTWWTMDSYMDGSSQPQFCVNFKLKLQLGKCSFWFQYSESYNLCFILCAPLRDFWTYLWCW